MAYAGDNKVVLFGGNIGYDFIGETWIYDGETDQWSQYNTDGVKPTARVHAVMSYASENKVIMYGGGEGYFAEDGNVLNWVDETWEYDVSTHTWTQ